MSVDQLPTTAAYELSPMQSGMLFQALLCDQDSKSSGFDIEQLHLLLNEELETAELAAAFDEMAARHAVLSTSFHWENLEHPKQLINSAVSVPVEVENWIGLNAEQRAGRLREFLHKDRARGFNLSKAPLMRATVIRTAPGKSELVWTFHHILLDGRSFGPLLAELFSTYDTLRGMGGKVLAAPVRPYADYIAWLRQVDLEPSLRYFRALLAGKHDPTPLPCAEPKGRVRSNAGYGDTVIQLDQRVVTLARECAKRTNTTLGTMVQTAWALVLARYTGDADVVFGSCRTCRHSALNGDAASMVGLFINTLPIRVRTSDHQTPEELIADVRAQNLELRAHEHCPLVEIAKVAEYGGNKPLFETLVMYENRGLCQELINSGDPRWHHCTLSLHEQPSIPLSITAYDGSAFELRALYDCDRLRTSAVDRLLAAFASALELLATQTNQPLAELDVLPADERELVLFRWNDTARNFPDQLRIHQLFEAQVERTPDAVAVEKDGASLTYRELDQRANRIAHALQARGARPNVYIALCLSRGIDLVTGLLAIAKSGAAYVPLDPKYPKERLAFMLTDSQVALVVTEERYRDLFDAPCFVLEREQAALAELPADRAVCLATPEDVCYVIFTSGSTGVPKGVVLTHRAVVNTLDWVSREFRVGPGDRLLFVTSHCFDLSVYDTFGVLGAGGTVVVAGNELLSDPAALAAALVEREITIWDSAPAALQRITPFFSSSSVSAALRLVMLSGDWIPVTLPDVVRRAFPAARIKSLGGATEAAVWSNWYDIGEVDPNWSSIPYGKPIQNCRYYVLDKQLRPAPIGVAGDLYIGGICLANGYLNRDALTRERFIADPFRPGQRMYATGDLARFFESGDLEFLGRSDFQVKIRGYRVEMGEVESALLALSGVRAAVCSAVCDASGQLSLVAYLVAEDGQELIEERVKEQLAVKLPEFMLPSQILLLDALPLSANGKVDRKALPNPALRAPALGFVAPRTELEQQLARLWEEILNVRPISIRNDFFKLGGHSLLAVMLISRLKSELGLDVPLSLVMERPTIETLAQALDASALVPRAKTHLFAQRETGTRPPLFLFPGAGGYSFFFRDMALLLGDDQPVYTLRAIGAEGEALHGELTIEQMAEIHLREMLEVRPEGPYILAGYSFGVLLAYEVARQLRQHGRTIPLLISFDGYAPGYPKLMPLPQRMLSHLTAYLKADAANRQRYLEDRLTNVYHRIMACFGCESRRIDPIPFADSALNDRLRSLWAHLWRARNSYHPTSVEPLDLLLIKTATPQQWPGSEVDPSYGWRDFVKGRIFDLIVPGEHLRLFDASNLALMARAVAERIDRCLVAQALFEGIPTAIEAVAPHAEASPRQCQGLEATRC